MVAEAGSARAASRRGLAELHRAAGRPRRWRACPQAAARQGHRHHGQPHPGPRLAPRGATRRAPPPRPPDPRRPGPATVQRGPGTPAPDAGFFGDVLHRCTQPDLSASGIPTPTAIRHTDDGTTLHTARCAAITAHCGVPPTTVPAFALAGVSVFVPSAIPGGANSGLALSPITPPVLAVLFAAPIRQQCTRRTWRASRGVPAEFRKAGVGRPPHRSRFGRGIG